jgi:hypothetical protein
VVVDSTGTNIIFAPTGVITIQFDVIFFPRQKR